MTIPTHDVIGISACILIWLITDIFKKVSDINAD